MMGKLGMLVFSVTMVVALIVMTLPREGMANPSLEEGLDVAEAIRFLEKLDKYYSQIARPRYGRSTDSHRKSFPMAMRSRKFANEADRR
ncbi:hypothetical protein JTE90_028280 [Oedothorax gibbosus]|uniref:Neuropeptide F n=1 Tax=Oedothorax gibbosus TaxID=931172 RepID=A0AAV6UBW4_9ARAC|nr:hypothetical protein JTE90_028280 [Oedothorax gibbosus]